MARATYASLLDGTRRVKLERFDPDDTADLDKEQAGKRLAKLGPEFTDLGNLLAFSAQHALLIVLQGRDASGKDGAIRRILDFSNIQTARVQAFKVPTTEELAHDFLWRVHNVVPRKGHIAIFNRSHYEDVLAARVHKIVPEHVWRGRFEHINAFERLLVDSGTIVLKFYLHISQDEQYQRLVERESGPRTAWKLDPADWRDVPLWDEMTAAYEDVLNQCSSVDLPWYLVPANKKWFRNVAVMERIVLTLRPYRPQWEAALAAMGKQALSEIGVIRSRLVKPPRIS